MQPAAGSAAQRLATVGGIGRVPLAPGTAGSLVGLVLSLPLLSLGWPLHLAAALLPGGDRRDRRRTGRGGVGPSPTRRRW